MYSTVTMYLSHNCVVCFDYFCGAKLSLIINKIIFGEKFKW